MNPIRVLALGFISIIVFDNCNNTLKTENRIDSSKISIISPSTDSFIYNNFNKKLNLNEGEKWVLKPIIIKNIYKIEQQIKEFNNDSIRNKIEEYKKISDKISNSIAIINENCDFKGYKEEVFHIWIIPFTELTDRLVYSKDVETCKKLIEEMKVYLKEFKRYFK